MALGACHPYPILRRAETEVGIVFYFLSGERLPCPSMRCWFISVKHLLMQIEKSLLHGVYQTVKALRRLIQVSRIWIVVMIQIAIAIGTGIAIEIENKCAVDMQTGFLAIGEGAIFRFDFPS